MRPRAGVDGSSLWFDARESLRSAGGVFRPFAGARSCSSGGTGTRAGAAA